MFFFLEVNEKNLSSQFLGCGKGIFKYSSTRDTPSISTGDWPWMVPLFKKTELGLQFFCSSTLINRELVVTGEA